MTRSIHLFPQFILGALMLLAGALLFPLLAGANVGDGTCFGTGDKAAGECDDPVGGGPTVYIPFGSLSVSPSTINQGESATLTWSCTEAGGQTQYLGYTSDFGPSSLNGSMSVSPSQTTTYHFNCYSSSGVSSPQSATLTVNALYVDVYAGSMNAGSATVGTPVTFSSTVYNQGNGTATNFPNSFQISGVGYVGAETHTVGAGGSAAISASYTFGSAGTYYVRACADTNTSGNGAISESDESNNCYGSNWAAFTVSPPPQADITAGDVSGGSSATTGVAWSYSATVSNIGTTASGPFPNVLWVENVALSDANSLSLAAGGSGTASGSYTFGSIGTYNVRVCGDLNSGWGSAITESNENNNCGNWHQVTVSAPLPTCSNSVDDDGDSMTDYPADPGCSSAADTTESPNPPSPPTVSFTSNDYVVSSGESVVLSWDSTNATTCVNPAGEGAGGFSTGGSQDGSDTTAALTSDANYQIQCTGAGGSVTESVSIDVTSPTAYITAEPTLVNGSGAGGATSLVWNAVEVASCTISATPSGPSFTSSFSPVAAGTTTTAVTGIQRQTDFTLQCTPLAGGSVSSTVQVNIRFDTNEF